MTRADLTEPSAPDVLPQYLAEGARKQDAETLRALAHYARALAEYQEVQAQAALEADAEQDADETPDEWDEDEWEDAVEDARDDPDVPAEKGTITVKEIDGRGYYYLQWREGDSVLSKYVAPVSPADSEN